MAETITYETLYDLLRKEKNNAELQNIDPLFYDNLVKYIKEKKDILNKKFNSYFLSFLTIKDYQILKLCSMRIF